MAKRAYEGPGYLLNQSCTTIQEWPQQAEGLLSPSLQLLNQLLKNDQGQPPKGLPPRFCY